MPEITLTFLIEIIGTIAFASSGAMVGIRKNLDVFGVLVLGVITAVGGGIIRDVILNLAPPTTFRYPVYMITAMITVLILFFGIRKKVIVLETYQMENYDRIMNVLDAIGLGAFTVLGINSAINAGYEEYGFLLVFLGLMTGVGGGILRDMMATETPYVLKKHIYACASIGGAVVCMLLKRIMPFDTAMVIGGVVVVVIRMLATKYHWNLPKPFENR